MEQQNQNKNNNNNNNQPKMPRFNMGWIYGLIIFTLLMLFFTDGGNSLTSAAAGSARQEATYTKFKEYVSKGYAQKVEVNTSEKKLKMFVKSKNIRDVFQQTAQQTGPEPFVSVQYGSPDELDKYLTEVQQKGLLVDFSYNNKTSSVLENFLYSVGPLLLFFVLMYFLFNRMGSGMGGGGGIFNVGKSKAKMYEKGNDLGITFKDVAGQAGAKQEVQEIVEFLKNPKKYTDLGGKIPKGALLVGPPGTGKTLLAKAVAGEAGVPFFSMSGSDFVEMFVGVGASRVRDVFQQAKAKAPCIIFIDEIDAVGRSRFSGIGGGHDEREQTLNALLVEMDGLETQEGVIVIAATNRVDVLDPALLRPGRFDRQIVIDLPDIVGRRKILAVHAKNIKTDATSDETADTVMAFMKKIGKSPCLCKKDVPGFIANRMQHALWREAISIVEHGIASPEDVDTAVKTSFGLRLPYLPPPMRRNISTQSSTSSTTGPKYHSTLLKPLLSSYL